MAHNPPRIWMRDKDYHDVAAAVRRKLAQWRSIDELADKMLAKAAQGERVVLSPGTAEFVGRAIKNVNTVDNGDN